MALLQLLAAIAQVLGLLANLNLDGRRGELVLRIEHGRLRFKFSGGFAVVPGVRIRQRRVLGRSRFARIGLTSAAYAGPKK